MSKSQPSPKGLYTSIIGTGVVAVCCFTPILVVTLSILGLSFFTPYLDYVLFPALAVMLIVTFLAYRKWKQGCDDNKIKDKNNNINEAILTCPKCGNKQKTEIPQDRCLASYQCDKCKEIISVPKESKNCCVICEYSNTVCPVAYKK